MKTVCLVLMLLLAACATAKHKSPPDPVDVYGYLPHADRTPCLPYDHLPWGTDRTQAYYQFRKEVGSDPLHVFHGVVHLANPQLPHREYKSLEGMTLFEYLDGQPPIWKCLPIDLSAANQEPINDKELKYSIEVLHYNRDRLFNPPKLPPNFNPFRDYPIGEEPVR